jgi:hypothetical protein
MREFVVKRNLRFVLKATINGPLDSPHQTKHAHEGCKAKPMTASDGHKIAFHTILVRARSWGLNPSL